MQEWCSVSDGGMIARCLRTDMQEDGDGRRLSWARLGSLAALTCPICLMSWSPAPNENLAISLGRYFSLEPRALIEGFHRNRSRLYWEMKGLPVDEF